MARQSTDTKVAIECILDVTGLVYSIRASSALNLRIRQGNMKNGNKRTFNARVRRLSAEKGIDSENEARTTGNDPKYVDFEKRTHAEGEQMLNLNRHALLLKRLGPWIKRAGL